MNKYIKFSKLTFIFGLIFSIISFVVMVQSIVIGGLQEEAVNIILPALATVGSIVCFVLSLMLSNGIKKNLDIKKLKVRLIVFSSIVLTIAFVVAPLLSSLNEYYVSGHYIGYSWNKRWVDGYYVEMVSSSWILVVQILIYTVVDIVYFAFLAFCIVSMCIKKADTLNADVSVETVKSKKVKTDISTNIKFDTNKISLLKQYKELLDAGGINEEEYNKLKSELLK